MANFFGMGFNCRNFVPGFLAAVFCSVALADFTDSDRASLDSIFADVTDLMPEFRTHAYNTEIDLASTKSAAQSAKTAAEEASTRANAAYSAAMDARDAALDAKTSSDSNGQEIDRVRRLLVNTDSDVSDILAIVQDDIPGLGDKVDALTAVCQSINDSLDTNLSSIDTHMQDGFSGVQTALFSIDQKIAVNPSTHGIVVDTGLSSRLAKLDDIYSLLSDGFRNLTNRIENAPLAYDPAFVTNSYASALAYFGNVPSNKVLSQYYRELFGHDPSSQELADFLSVYRATSFLGGIGDIYKDLSRDIYPPNLLTFTSIDNYFTSAMLTSGFTYSESNGSRTTLQNLGRIRYYQYGTRPLLEFFEQATNDYPLTGSPVLSSSAVDGRRKASFTSGFVDTVESLASSFTPSVDTNIASVATNEIQDVENSTIAGTWQQAKKTTPDNYELSSLTESVNTIVGTGSSSVLGVFETQGEEALTFDFPFTIGSQTTDLHYNIQATAPLFRPYVAFFAGIAKCIIVVYFGLQIWEKVVKEIWMGRRF